VLGHIEAFDSVNVTQAESVPSGASAGVSTPMFATELFWWLHGSSEAATCTVQPWVYNDRREAWVKQGATVDLTGSATFLMYANGSRAALQITAISGTYQRDTQLVSKGA
jgi:hypothetical protein